MKFKELVHHGSWYIYDQIPMLVGTKAGDYMSEHGIKIKTFETWDFARLYVTGSDSLWNKFNIACLLRDLFRDTELCVTFNRISDIVEIRHVSDANPKTDKLLEALSWYTKYELELGESVMRECQMSMSRFEVDSKMYGNVHMKSGWRFGYMDEDCVYASRKRIQDYLDNHIDFEQGSRLVAYTHEENGSYTIIVSKFGLIKTVAKTVGTKKLTVDNGDHDRYVRVSDLLKLDLGLEVSRLLEQKQPRKSFKERICQPS